ncbi:MAG: glutamate--tRNA ligase [Clostridia bacterium]|nr:glutamate--tRNA ligase [Clostridia bacterium]
MDYKKLADILFPDVTDTPEDIYAKYPKRELPEGAAVTRMAPSPTGFVHFGSMFPTITSERLAKQSGGVFYLRIEDTDAKREVEGGVEDIIETFRYYGIEFDEGATVDGDKGAYGPYRQRQRKDIYHVFAKELVLAGNAYPCFCTEEELADIHTQQETQKANFGYYGQWAKWRDRSLEDIEAALAKGMPYVLRFRSQGSVERKIKHTDLIKGDLELTENDIDHVLLKSDGIPTYHFAHVVDDRLMGTTHVVRGDEWLSTLPFHLQLFDTLGWKRPKYLHISPLMKMDGESKRKLSKRKDPEAAMSFYRSEGYPVDAVYEYVMTTLNSNFEEWRRANKQASARDFKFSHKKMSVSGSLFDQDKLTDVSKNVISAMDADTVYEQVTAWAKDYDKELYDILTSDENRAKSIFAIGRGGNKPRKDLSAWKDVRDYVSIFYPTIFKAENTFPDNVKEASLVLSDFAKTYNENDDMDTWFSKIKEICVKYGYAEKTGDYKKEPEKYNGHIGDISSVIRVAVTGRTNSPDMYAVMQIIGREETLKRIDDAIEFLNR